MIAEMLADCDGIQLMVKWGMFEINASRKYLMAMMMTMTISNDDDDADVTKGRYPRAVVLGSRYLMTATTEMSLHPC